MQQGQNDSMDFNNKDSYFVESAAKRYGLDKGPRVIRDGLVEA